MGTCRLALQIFRVFVTIAGSHAFVFRNANGSIVASHALRVRHGDEAFDFEAVRRQLERLINERERLPIAEYQQLEGFSVARAVKVPVQSPLTAVERVRRATEIRLLSELYEDEEAISELWTLWFDEKGIEACDRLVQALEDEAGLRQLIAEYPDWPEAMNRLSTLLYLQKRYEESLTWLKRILVYKPWHFGALSGIVLVYAANNDALNARSWAARRLPPLESRRRRQMWVEKAICQATTSLQVCEAGHMDLFGVSTSVQLEEGAWQ